MKRYVIMIIMAILLSGCTKSTTTDEISPEDIVPEVVEPEDETQKELTIEEKKDVLSGYYSLLNQNKELEEITTYLDNNIEKVDEDIVDDIVLSLEEYVRNIAPSMKTISDTLMKYYDYVSEEVKSYLDIINREGQNVYTDGEMMKVDLNELIERALMTEKHLYKYAGGKTIVRINDFYEGYITGIIIGTGNQYIYAEEGSSKIKDEVLNTYKHFIESNEDSNITEILKQYLEKLSMDDYDMNGENVLKFYDDLPSIIDNYK